MLPDYQADELVQIAEEVAGRNDFTLTEAAKITLRQRIEKAQVDETFGNARAVTNIVLDAIFAKGRETDGKELKWDDFTILKPEDVRGFDPPQTERNAEARLQALIGLAQVKTELKKSLRMCPSSKNAKLEACRKVRLNCMPSLLEIQEQGRRQWHSCMRRFCKKLAI